MGAHPWLTLAFPYAGVYISVMDALVGLLDGVRANDAFVLRSLLSAPWSLRIEDRAPLTIATVVRGTAWVRHDGHEPVCLEPHDLAILRGPSPYVVADSPTTEPTIKIVPGQRCLTIDGRNDVTPVGTFGVRTWGNSSSGETELLTGVYESQNEVSRRLLDALPPLAVVRADTLDSPLIGYLAEQSGRDDPGQEAVLDRLLDLLLIAALRQWFSRPDAHTPSWYRAQSDSVVGSAIRLMQNEPAHGWTVAELAARTGMSRAGFARRFARMVGEPPMGFLTGWRLSLAADLLREPRATVGSVARLVGYSTPYALSAAFKRERGISPSEWAGSAA